MSTQNDKNEVHVYDGIVEHDNFLPRWWLAILYGSMVFALFYFLHYTFGPGPTLVEEYQASVQELDALKAKASAQAPGAAQGSPQSEGSDEGLKAWAIVAEHKAQGKQVFESKCVVCHGNLGQGGIGPNLTDDYWIHGNKLSQIASTVTNGVSDKGMPPWGALLSADELKSVVAYVQSLHGTNPPNPKAPQGEKLQ